METKIIFNIVANGFKEEASILNFSGIIFTEDKYYNVKIKKIINRFYFRGEEEEEDASVKISKLYDETIKRKREDLKSYDPYMPSFFRNDKFVVDLLFQSDILIGHDIKNYALRNIRYWHEETRNLLKEKQILDTYLNGKYLLKKKGIIERQDRFRLDDAINILEIDRYKVLRFALDIMNKINMKDDDLDFHAGLYDVFCNFAVYRLLNKKYNLSQKFLQK